MYIVTLVLPPFWSSPHAMDVWGVVHAKFEYAKRPSVVCIDPALDNAKVVCPAGNTCITRKRVAVYVMRINVALVIMNSLRGIEITINLLCIET